MLRLTDISQEATGVALLHRLYCFDIILKTVGSPTRMASKWEITTETDSSDTNPAGPGLRLIGRQSGSVVGTGLVLGCSRRSLTPIRCLQTHKFSSLSCELNEK